MLRDSMSGWLAATAARPRRRLRRQMPVIKRSCRVAWCKADVLEQGWLLHRAANGSGLTAISLLSSAVASKLMYRTRLDGLFIVLLQQECPINRATAASLGKMSTTSLRRLATATATAIGRRGWDRSTFPSPCCAAGARPRGQSV
jgi:hypothetical protein